MQPFEVDGIDRVLLALEPVARDLRDGYLLEPARVIPVPVGQQRRRPGPQAGRRARSSRSYRGTEPGPRPGCAPPSRTAGRTSTARDPNGKGGGDARLSERSI